MTEMSPDNGIRRLRGEFGGWVRSLPSVVRYRNGRTTRWSTANLMLVHSMVLMAFVGRCPLASDSGASEPQSSS